MAEEAVVKMTPHEDFLLVSDMAYNVWMHRPPIDHKARDQYQKEVEKRLVTLVKKAAALRTLGPVPVSPFISACILEASALARAQVGPRIMEVDVPSHSPEGSPVPSDEGSSALSNGRSSAPHNDASPTPSDGESHTPSDDECSPDPKDKESPPTRPPVTPSLSIKVPPRSFRPPNAHAAQVPVKQPPAAHTTPHPTPGSSSSTVPLSKVGPPSCNEHCKPNIIGRSPTKQPAPQLPALSKSAQETSGKSKQPEARGSSLAKKATSDEAAVSTRARKTTGAGKQAPVPAKVPEGRPSGKGKKAQVPIRAQSDPPDDGVLAHGDQPDEEEAANTTTWPRILLPSKWPKAKDDFPLGWLPSYTQ
ncbi:hypothetical protein LXA43DRAFT_1096399 [Ganoderma leucocontextum]|nr:hypothetical protein LXA43DRAFT_1096399 [Ganoderma leucocontextum]